MATVGALKAGVPKMPQIYISKYNRFVDAVLNRINRVLGKQYDPVRVKLLSQLQRNNVKGKDNKPIKGKKNKTAGKKESKEGPTEKTHKMGELELARTKNDKLAQSDVTSRSARSGSAEPEFVLISKAGSTEGTDQTKSTTNQLRATPVRQNNKKKVSSSTTTKKTSTNKKKPTTTKSGNKTKQKQPTTKNKQKARATLFGLSTLKRDGDVTVNMLPEYTNVKTNFVLGPLTLRVEREVGRSGKRELRSAAATTAEMYGRLNLRLVHGGVATLHSIRVLQPKQVRIDTADNHDKTTEFMWKRSPQIATIVSQKLGAVAKSMLKPPPQPRP